MCYSMNRCVTVVTAGLSRLSVKTDLPGSVTQRSQYMCKICARQVLSDLTTTSHSAQNNKTTSEDDTLLPLPHITLSHVLGPTARIFFSTFESNLKEHPKALLAAVASFLGVFFTKSFTQNTPRVVSKYHSDASTRSSPGPQGREQPASEFNQPGI